MNIQCSKVGLRLIAEHRANESLTSIATEQKWITPSSLHCCLTRRCLRWTRAMLSIQRVIAASRWIIVRLFPIEDISASSVHVTVTSRHSFHWRRHSFPGANHCISVEHDTPSSWWNCVIPSFERVMVCVNTSLLCFQWRHFRLRWRQHSFSWEHDIAFGVPVRRDTACIGQIDAVIPLIERIVVHEHQTYSSVWCEVMFVRACVCVCLFVCVPTLLSIQLYYTMCNSITCVTVLVYYFNIKYITL